MPGVRADEFGGQQSMSGQTASIVRPRWERFAPAAGIGFAIVVAGALFGVFAAGAEPNDPFHSVVATLTSERTGLLVRYNFQLAASGMFMIYLSNLCSTLRRAEGGEGMLSYLAFGAGLIGIAFVTFNNALNAALVASIVQSAGDGAVWAVFQVGQAVFTFAALFLGLFLLAASLVIVRTKALPRWTGWMGLVGGAAYVVGSFSVADQRGPIALPAVVGFMIFLVWTIVTSAVLLLRTAREGGSVAAR
jgi:hypothetical protein